MHRDLVKDAKACGAFLLRSASSSQSSRERRGDRLQSFVHHPGEFSAYEELPPNHLWVSFASVLQGDHAGAEIATSAHEHWLQRFGLLDFETRLVASRCLCSPHLLQGLVIDDFSASVEKREAPNDESRAADCYFKSQRAYSAGWCFYQVK